MASTAGASGVERVVDRSQPRVVLAQPSQNGWNLEFHPQSAHPHAVSEITASFEHQLLEIDGASTFPRVTLEPGAAPKGRLTVPLRLKEGLRTPTELVEGRLTIHYIDASNGQAYWQPWRCVAGAKSDKGPYFELRGQLAIDTDGLGQKGLKRRILRKMLEMAGSRPCSLMTEKIAAALELDVDEVGMALDALTKSMHVNGIRVTQEPYPIWVGLESTGVDVARDGWPEGDSGGRQSIYVGDNARNVTIGQGGRDVHQQIRVDVTYAEIRQVLDELKLALAAFAEDDDDREDRERAVERVGRQLTSTEPDVTRGRRAWEHVVGFATVEGTVQGLERIYKALSPLVSPVSDWYGGSPPLPPGMLA